MLPLQDCKFLICHFSDKHHVTRLSDRGDVLGNLISTDEDIRGLILFSNNNCLILHKNSLQHVRI